LETCSPTVPHSFDEAIFVDIVAQDQSPVDAPDDDVVEHTFGIESGMTGHSQWYQTEAEWVKSYLPFYGRPLRSPIAITAVSRDTFEDRILCDYSIKNL
jgi:hypothetical protein